MLYSAGLTSTLLTEAATMQFVAGSSGRAGVITKATGGNKSGFELFVNQRLRAETSGERGVLSLLLKPYQQYQVNIEAKGEALTSINGDVKKLSLYPGNVVTLSWPIDPIFIVVAQAVDRFGAPLAFSRINNLNEYSVTDEQGWFQVELTEKKSLHLTMPSGQECRISFPESPEGETLYVFEQLFCQ
jgi:hypothetical protein